LVPTEGTATSDHKAVRGVTLRRDPAPSRQPYRVFYEKSARRLIAEKPRANGEEPHAIYAWRNLRAATMAAGCNPS